MAVYTFRPDVERKLDRAGLSQAELARQAGLSIYGIRDKIRKGQRTRGRNAWEIARVYAKATGISEEEALQALFVADTPAETPPIRPTPDLAVRLKVAY
jgi:hypothetical protein